MSPGLAAMWLSFVAMGLLIVAALLIMFSRAKLKGFFKAIFSFVAYLLLIFGGLLMILVVINWPD